MREDRERRRGYEADIGLRPSPGDQGLGLEFPNPGIGWTWLIKILIKVLGAIMPVITPTLTELLKNSLLEFYKQALETPNPWDDFLARFLLRILDIPVPAEE